MPTPRAALAWWALAGLACGAAMASKYTGVLLPAFTLVAIVAIPSLRRQLATPGPYLAVALASLVMIPVLRWNAHHDWISFRFQLAHGLGPVRGTGIKREGDLLGGQLGLVTPILFVMMAIAVARALEPMPDARRTMFASISTLTFLFFVYSAWRRPAEANWPAPAYIPALALLAAYPVSSTWKKWLTAGCVLGAHHRDRDLRASRCARLPDRRSQGSHGARRRLQRTRRARRYSAPGFRRARWHAGARRRAEIPGRVGTRLVDARPS